MKITVAIQSFLFERRLCWLLSSVLQQQGDIPEIIVDVAYVLNSGKPRTKEVIGFFRRQGLNIVTHPYKEMEDIMYRGQTRNHQVQDTDSDWIVFIDSDMVYSPTFFAEMKRLLEGEFKDNPRCLISRRRSTYLEETEKLVAQYEYPCVIPSAFDTISKLDSKVKSNVGAGYFHLANVELLRKNFQGLYCNPNKKRDRSWITGAPKARSDMVFRRKLGREKIPLPIQYHAQHTRGMVEGGGYMLYNQK